MTNSFLDNTGLSDTNSLKHLTEKISPETDNEVDLTENSRYYDDTTLRHTFLSNNGLKIVSLNCQSLNVDKVNKLKIFLHKMNNNASPISCILLQETWCDSSVDLSLF